jgi:hypothetical protein
VGLPVVVTLPVAKPPVVGKGENGIVVAVPTADAEATLPLWVTVEVTPKLTLPLPPLPPMAGAPVDPPMVIRTGGRK